MDQHIPPIAQADSVFNPVHINDEVEMFRDGHRVVFISALRRALHSSGMRLRDLDDQQIKSLYTLDGVLDQDAYTVASETTAALPNGELSVALHPASSPHFEYGSSPHIDPADGRLEFHPGLYDPPSYIQDRTGWVSAILSMQLSWRTAY